MERRSTQYKYSYVSSDEDEGVDENKLADQSDPSNHEEEGSDSDDSKSSSKVDENSHKSTDESTMSKDSDTRETSNSDSDCELQVPKIAKDNSKLPNDYDAEDTSDNDSESKSNDDSDDGIRNTKSVKASKVSKTLTSDKYSKFNDECIEESDPDSMDDLDDSDDNIPINTKSDKESKVSKPGNIKPIQSSDKNPGTHKDSPHKGPRHHNFKENLKVCSETEDDSGTDKSDESCQSTDESELKTQTEHKQKLKNGELHTKCQRELNHKVDRGGKPQRKSLKPSYPTDSSSEEDSREDPKSHEKSKAGIQGVNQSDDYADSDEENLEVTERADKTAKTIKKDSKQYENNDNSDDTDESGDSDDYSEGSEDSRNQIRHGRKNEAINNKPVNNKKTEPQMKSAASRKIQADKKIEHSHTYNLRSKSVDKSQSGKVNSCPKAVKGNEIVNGHSNDDCSSDAESSESLEDSDDGQSRNLRSKSHNKSRSRTVNSCPKSVKGNEKVNSKRVQRLERSKDEKEPSEDDSETSDQSSVDENGDSSDDSESLNEGSDKENKMTSKQKKKGNVKVGVQVKSTRQIKPQKKVNCESELSEESSTGDEEVKGAKESFDEKEKTKGRNQNGNLTKINVAKQSSKISNNRNQGTGKQNTGKYPESEHHNKKGRCNDSSTDESDVPVSKKSGRMEYKSKKRVDSKVISGKKKTERCRSSKRSPDDNDHVSVTKLPVSKQSQRNSKKRKEKENQSAALNEATSCVPVPPPLPPPIVESSKEVTSNDKLKNTKSKVKPSENDIRADLCNEIKKFQFKKPTRNVNVAVNNPPQGAEEEIRVTACPTPTNAEEGDAASESKTVQAEIVLSKAGVFKHIEDSFGNSTAESKDGNPSFLPNEPRSLLSLEDRNTLDVHTQLMKELLLLRGSNLRSPNHRKRSILPKEPDLISILKTAITQHQKAKNGDSESDDSAMEDANWEDNEQVAEQQVRDFEQEN